MIKKNGIEEFYVVGYFFFSSEVLLGIVSLVSFSLIIMGSLSISIEVSSCSLESSSSSFEVVFFLSSVESLFFEFSLESSSSLEVSLSFEVSFEVILLEILIVDINNMIEG